MKQKISLSDIRTFVVLAQSGSFTNAAEVLMCSRSHISKQLAQLESDLGVTLLTRTTRTQKLTPQGEAFFERCQSSLRSIDTAVDRVLESSASLHGLIKINCVGGFIGEDMVAPLVNDFMAAYPGVSIELDFSSRRVDLVSGEFDFVFRMGQLDDSALIARKLTDIHIDTFASPGYLKQHGRPGDPKDLKHHRCIVGSMHHWAFISLASSKKLEVPVSASLRCKNGRTMVSSALAGNGIIRVPELYCQNELKSGELEPVFSDWKVQSTPLYLVYLQDKHQPQRLQTFKDFVMEKFAAFLPV
ncbi:LysR family transcriptional regulator [Thalassomonas actiniarum]|uniref:LysR family transcriptional regulator n=1 Tax=Thalassomonas actiniarum TaxID=485447 RepID=A0AAE9YNM0_9GAMM|nr:LysR family transcriptional regulator [Thalassomonas actiniarum]WDD97648.1 LysR family transcriptional regulator [Thalassomonas actiniarum]